tara:strand:+ start:1804 stop:2046 length:243 start_codon:yes stop_codon:yes gene_type:complete
MELIEGVALSQLCDYSFGDQAGQWGNIYTHFMKDASLVNVEFVNRLFEIKKSRNYMTLFMITSVYIRERLKRSNLKIGPP